MSAQLFKEARTVAQSFVEFVNEAKSPWHAVDTVRKLLIKQGFSQLHEKENWKPAIKTNGRYFFTRNESSIVAFAVGGKYKAGNGFKIIGAHTDSPDLKIKPISAQEKVGYLQVSVQTYGGGLWYSWFDRDLTVAGRAIIETAEKKYEHRLVDIKKPILRIPSLAIHLNREVNEKGFSFNTETNLLPIISTAVKEQLGEGEKKEEKTGVEANHHPILMGMLAEQLQCKVSSIKDLELSIVDTQPAQIGGAQDEFIFAPRIDNLMSCFCGLEALFNTDNTLETDEDVRMVAMFDHEEIGSKSASGAYSSLLNDVLKRVITVLATEETPGDAYEQSIHKSFLVSSDMAHAVHPNYSEKHQEKHRPMIHKGPVIKTNANQRYATNAVTGFIMKEIATRNKVPYQEFVVRNDTGCGSTIGPLLAGQLGVRTVDIGIPQLSMHSIREMCGVVDVKYGVELLTGFINDFRAVDSVIKMD